MPLTYWSVACGLLIAVFIIWLTHKIGALHSGPRASQRTKDRIWILEKAFFGVAISILIIAHSKELLTILQGHHPSEQVERDFIIAFVSFIGSALILLIAKFADSILGDE